MWLRPLTFQSRSYIATRELNVCVPALRTHLPSLTDLVMVEVISRNSRIGKKEAVLIGISLCYTNNPQSGVACRAECRSRCFCSPETA